MRIHAIEFPAKKHQLRVNVFACVAMRWDLGESHGLTMCRFARIPVKGYIYITLVASCFLPQMATGRKKRALSIDLGTPVEPETKRLRVSDQAQTCPSPPPPWPHPFSCDSGPIAGN